MKRKLAIGLTGLMMISLAACGGGGSTDTGSSVAKTDAPQEATTQASEEEKVYQIGDTWEVEGLWKVTINSVTETDERNEYSDKEPAAVYVIDYTYENIGYDDSITDGFYFSFEMEQIVDAEGEMGYAYPGDITNYPDEVPIGATCTAENVIGVNHAGDFTIQVSEYGTDDDLTKYKATFEIKLK